MPKKQESLRKKVFFNASVIIAGVICPKGGSAKLLNMVRTSEVDGIISEIIIDEVLRHASKTNIKKHTLERRVCCIFRNISDAPDEKSVRIFEKVVIDPGDSHVLASCSEFDVDYLVTLDKKHLLVLKDKIRKFNIVTPGDLLQLLR